MTATDPTAEVDGGEMCCEAGIVGHPDIPCPWHGGEALRGTLVTHRAIVSGDVDGWHVICQCGFRAAGVDVTAHLADAILASDWLAALLDRERREAGVEALREASLDLDVPTRGTIDGVRVVRLIDVTAWLRDQATRIEAGS